MVSQFKVRGQAWPQILVLSDASCYNKKEEVGECESFKNA